MKLLLPLMAVSVFLAALSQWHTAQYSIAGTKYNRFTDWAYFLLVVILIFFAGLRTRYNDTANYMRSFLLASDLQGFLSDPENFNLFSNPLFDLYESFLKTFTSDPQVLIFTTAAFSQFCLVRFIKRYSEHFAFSIFLYFTLGTFVFSLAAIKQVLAMSIMTLAFPSLEKKHWGRYYLVVLIAMMFHTYAVMYAILPFFRARPWKTFTFVFIAVMAVILMNFEEALTAVMDQADELGKSMSETEVFDDATINVFRLAVYAVPPLLSLFLSRWVLYDSTEMDNIMIHMSVISLAFMSLGTQAGANMFGRMGNYFEMGTIICLPRMLHKAFETASYRLISLLACVGYLGFFYYANAVKLDFGEIYQMVNILDLLPF